MPSAADVTEYIAWGLTAAAAVCGIVAVNLTPKPLTVDMTDLGSASSVAKLGAVLVVLATLVGAAHLWIVHAHK